MLSRPKLTLPPAELRIEWIDEKQQVWDVIRKQWTVLTPEEWVRQHFIHLLIHHLNYPRSLFKIESSFSYGTKKKRSDIQVLRTDGTVFLLVECKSPDTKLNDRTLKQISIYNKTLKASYIGITNGNHHFSWKYDETNQKFTSMKEFPDFSNR
jgi:hypothetical protein